jgi:cobalt-zinc-cadmium efflux system protein
MTVEVVGGLVANSLALLADAGHMVIDAASIGLALLALWAAARPESFRYTFGFKRVEVLSALLNCLSLSLIALWIFWEAYQRFQKPPDVQGSLVLGVGFIGLLINVAAALILRRSARESINAEGAYLHVLGDLLGSIGVVIAAILIMAFGWFLADPIFGVIIGMNRE